MSDFLHVCCQHASTTKYEIFTPYLSQFHKKSLPGSHHAKYFIEKNADSRLVYRGTPRRQSARGLKGPSRPLHVYSCSVLKPCTYVCFPFVVCYFCRSSKTRSFCQLSCDSVTPLERARPRSDESFNFGCSNATEQHQPAPLYYRSETVRVPPSIFASSLSARYQRICIAPQRAALPPA